MGVYGTGGPTMDKGTERKCYRVEERTVIPGVTVFVHTRDGSEAMGTYTTLYVVVEGISERYFSCSSEVFRFTSDMRPSDFFQTQAEAEEFARGKHATSGCTNPECGWSRLPLRRRRMRE
jgi:hypothetical protein